ncbi:hypothetical protein HPB50_002387 [Hyalomma asiaticum]|uniref:Uncharacterized protein n=1 Tax=Hyalomma asiaticum TaxID=266040 RepID=A0ACB7TFV2_HYAAI|nr:hypothetical protein HPB50_002387 [Hyalomma asiaticum]
MVLNYHRSQGEAQPDLCTSSTDGSSSAGSATVHQAVLTTLLRYFRWELESQERALEHRPDNSIGAIYMRAGHSLPREQVKETLRELLLPVGDDSIEKDAAIDVLIGSNQFWECLTRRIKKLNSKLTAVETVFGWAVQGPTVSKCKAVNCAQVVVLRASVTDQQTESTHRLFWELEGVDVSDTPEKLPNVQIMEESTKGIKTVDGRYEVRLPERKDVAVGDNRFVSEETWPIEQQFENYMPDELDQKRVQTSVFPIELRSTENRAKMPSNSPPKEFVLTTDIDGLLRIREHVSRLFWPKSVRGSLMLLPFEPFGRSESRCSTRSGKPGGMNASCSCVQPMRPKQVKAAGPKIGEVILVQENVPRLLWKRGVIVSVCPGRDGKVRSCMLRMPGI